MRIYIQNIDTINSSIIVDDKIEEENYQIKKISYYILEAIVKKLVKNYIKEVGKL